MRKLHYLFLVTALMVAFCGAKAQPAFLCNEKFSSKIPQGWTVQPASTAAVPTWTSEKGLTISPNYAMHGYVPFNSGDTVEMVTPFFDCSQYRYVMIRFSHICKVLPSDICEIMYQEQGMGGYYKWRTLPADAYTGGSTTYSRTMKFSHSSYPEWKDADTFATPAENWWKEETFDVSDYASYTTIRFKFVIRKGSYYGSFVANGWYVEDFQVVASQNVLKNPVVQFLSTFNDTVYSTGPFAIRAKVATRSDRPIQKPVLKYTAVFQKQTVTKNVAMTAEEGDTVWSAVIPQQQYGTTITYSIDAADSAGNTARATDGFVLKRKPGVKITSYTYFNGADTANPIYTYANAVYLTSTVNPTYARSLYLASEIGASNSSVSIANIAWYNPNSVVSVTRNLKVWLLATTSTTTTGSLDPSAAGATLVFNGSVNSCMEWNQIEFDAPFNLPAGRNLMVFFEASGGTVGASNIAWTVYYVTNRSVYSTNLTAYNKSSYVPIMRFGLGIPLDYDSNSVAMTSIDRPGIGAASGVQTVTVTIQNKGVKNLTSARIDWKVNGVLQTPKTWTGNLTCDFYDHVTLGTYVQRVNTYDTIEVWVGRPNGTTDNVLLDDTLRAIPYGCGKSMGGVYTVGQKNCDFQSIEEAMFLLNVCGASSDVIFKLEACKINRPLAISDFGSNMGNYRLVITSMDNNAGSVVFTASSNVLELKRVSHICFENVTFAMEGKSGRTIIFKGACSDIEFRHCRITGMGSDNYEDAANACVYNQNASLYDIRFVGNEVVSGTFAFYLTGSSLRKIAIDSNSVHHFMTGNYFENVTEFSFSHNGIDPGQVKDYGKRPFWYNRFLQCYDLLIDGNRIVSALTEKDNLEEQKAIHVERCDSARIWNNEICLPYSPMGRNYGIVFLSNNASAIAHNSILVNSAPKDNSYGINMDAANGRNAVRNNIVVGVSDNTWPLYINNTSGITNYDMDYNCWSSTGVIAYIYTNQWSEIHTLSELKAVIPSSVHDIIYTPLFVNDTDLRLKSFANLNCPRFRDLSWDKYGMLRTAATTIGCYSNNPPQKDGGLSGVLYWPGTSHAGDTLRPYVILQNGGLDTLTSASICFALNGVTGATVKWTGKLPTSGSDTLPLGRFILNSGYNNLTVYLVDANGNRDSVTNDDTVRVETYTCSSYFAGDYKVGAGCEFATLESAINAIRRCGMNGPVTLRLLAGTYASQLVLGDLPGISDTNTLTITSLSGNNDVVLRRVDEGNRETAPIIIEDGSHIILKRLVFDANCQVQPLSYSYAHGVILRGNTRHIEISDCEVTMPSPDGTAFGSAAQYSAFQLLGRTVYNIKLSRNVVHGGGCGIYVYGTDNGARLRRVEIVGNELLQMDFSGIHLVNTDSVTVKGNRITQRVGNYITPNMQCISAIYTNANLLNNRINVSTIERGIYLQNFGDTGTGYASIFNNELIGKVAASDGCGMYIGAATQALIRHNSLFVGSNQRVASAVWLNANNLSIDFSNNIVYMNGKEYNNYPVYRASNSNNDLKIGYNAYYNAYPNTPLIGYLNNLIVDRSEWLQALPQDTTSRVVQPEFMNPNNDLRISDTTGISCPVSADPGYDILDSLRNGSVTNMGAYIFYRSKLDLALKAIVSPVDKASASHPETLKVVIANRGTATVTSAKLNYSLNGIVGSVFSWSGSLATSATDTITLGTMKAANGTNMLSVFICEVNGTKDNSQGNDTLDATLYGCDGPLKGTYTIGNGAQFASVNDAMNTLNICGIGGHVTFEVLSGSYMAPVFENILYTSPTSTITFTSKAGNADSVVFSGVNGLQLKTTYHMTFKNLTFKGSVTGVSLEGTHFNVFIRHCNISVPQATSPEYRGVSYDNTPNSNRGLTNFQLVGNRIDGGYYNIYIKHANSNTNGSTTPKLVIDSNVMTGAYRYGFYSEQSNYIRTIAYNIIRNHPDAEEYYGIYTTTNTSIDSVCGNVIHIRNSKKGYGIYATNNQNVVSQLAGVRKVFNNEIIVNGDDEKYGIYYYSPNGHANFNNNSIFVNGSASSYALYLYASSYSLSAFNNLLAGGNSNSIPLYASSTSNTVFPRDYNNYSANGGDLAYIGGTRKDLVAVKAASANNDQHSLAVKADWTDVMNNLRIRNSWMLRCPLYDQVGIDVAGEPRSYQTAMGCYDLEPDSADAGLTAFGGTDLLTSTGSHPITVVLKNYGRKDIQTATVSLYINGVRQPTVTYSPSRPLALRNTDTVKLGTFAVPAGLCNLKAYVTLQGDNNVLNDTVTFQKTVCSALVSGTYAVGNSSQSLPFNNFDFLDILKKRIDSCGINGDVTLAFESGTYNFANDLTLNTGFMQGYRLIWTSQAGNRDSVVFTSSLGGNATQGMIILGGANNVYFHDITFSSTNHTIFQVNGPNENVVIRHCNLFNGRTVTAGATQTITNGDNPSGYYKQKNWRVVGNHFEGGCRSFKFRGSTTEPLINWTIDSNLFEYGYDRVIQIEVCDTFRFCYNTVISRTSTTGNHFALYTSNLNHTDSIVGNYFDATLSTTNKTGMIVTCYGVNRETDYPVVFANNIIKTNNTGGYGLNFHGKAHIVHNSIYMTGATSTATGARFYLAGTNIKLVGNIFYGLGNHTPVLFESTTIDDKHVMDYNNYYSAGGNKMNWGGSVLKSMQAVQLTTGQDTHSICVPLSFIDPGVDLRLTNYAPVLMPNLGLIGFEYSGQPRSNPTAMGAYEPSFQKLDATLVDFANTHLNGGQSCPVSVTLTNLGTDTLTTADLNWTVNGSLQQPVKWTGSLPVGTNTVVLLGNVVPATGSITRIVAWVCNPNNGIDSKPFNDTVSMSEYGCSGALAGSYTVGGGNPDFMDLNEAFFTLNTCGISAPVILRLRSGTYASQQISGNVPGSSRMNTVTLQPDSGAAVVIDGGGKTASLTVSNAAHWIFKGLTIGNLTDGLTGVLLKENLEDITFRDCDILANVNATSTDYRCVSYPNTNNSGKYPVDVRFVHNNIQGGYYNFYLYYTASTSSLMTTASIAIDSNVLKDAYTYGIYSYYYSVIKSLQNNVFTNRSGSSSYYGVYSYYYAYWDKIEGNRMHLTATGSTYGFYMYYYNQHASYTGSAKANMTNNEIIIQSDAGIKYGIYIYYPNGFWEVHNNSIYTESSGNNYGLNLYNTSTSYKINVSRNLVVCNGGGANYPLYVSSATYVGSAYGLREYNNFYSPANVAYVGGNATSVSGLQSITGQDLHTVSSMPSFVDASAGMMLNDYNAYVCRMHPDVTKDIDGKFRGNATAMGCYGAKLYAGLNLEVTEIVSPKAITDVVCYEDYSPVAVAYKNSGLADAHFDSSALKVSLDVSGAISFHKDTVISSGVLKSSWTDTLWLGSIPTMNSGSYHIRILLSDTSDIRPEDDTMSIIYNAHRVELPYDISFSVQPNEFVNSIKSGSTGWHVVNGQGSHPSIYPVYGTGRLEFVGLGEPGAMANAVFNAVNIRGCVNPRLSFWYAHAECDKRDMMIVLVTTDGGATYSEVGRVIAADTADYWKQYDFDLSPYANSQCLSVVFQAVSFGGINQNIDRIRITGDQDVALSLLPFDLDAGVACDHSPVDVKAVLTNYSPLKTDLTNDTVNFIVSGAENLKSYFVYNGSIAGFGTDTITVGQIDIAANGHYYIELYMQSQDDNTRNDTLRDSSLFIDQNIMVSAIRGIDDQIYKHTGDTVRLSAVVVNAGNVPVDRYLVRMNLDGNVILTDTVSELLGVGDSCIHVMSRPYMVPSVAKDQPFYYIELVAEMDCDADNGDNGVSVIGNVEIPDTIDLQLLEIKTTSPALGKTRLSPSVRIANVGNVEADNVVLHISVLDKDKQVVESISEFVSHLSVNENKEHRFAMSYKVPDYTGTYMLKAYVEAYTGDTLRNNDTLVEEFSCYRDSVGIRDIGIVGWTMGQNIPNPASSTTVIPFEVPQAGEIHFTVMNVNGQLVHQETVMADAGSNSLSFNTIGLADGIYYYCMEYRGQRIVRKMNIMR